MESVGRYLQSLRETQGMSLEEIARATRIPVSSIERIEGDHFDDLPGEVFVRGFLRAYARAVQASADDVLARYTAGRRASTATQIPLASAPQGRRSSTRRVGVAIAFVLLLILFTVAISIVLRPRGQGMPRELSQVNEAPSALDFGGSRVS
ncbi:MAG: helix-turn-helix domain-containing protein [Polyangiaceae bacterium]